MYSIATDQTFALSPNTNDSMGMRSIWSATSLTHTFGSQVNFASIDWDFNTFMLEVEAAQTTSQFNTITTYVHEVIPLQHPRPERRAAHMLAVEKFEQVRRVLFLLIIVRIFLSDNRFVFRVLGRVDDGWIEEHGPHRMDTILGTASYAY